MGNVHSVVQIAPLVSIEGAALRVRAGKEAAFAAWLETTKVPAYAAIQREVPELVIANINVGPSTVRDPGRETVYVVVNGGGKWNYDDQLNDFLHAAAPFLDDARFFLNDEYARFIDEYAFANGALAIRRVVETNGDVNAHAMEQIAHDADKRYAFAMQIVEMWLDLSEPAGATSWVDLAIGARPSSWEAHYARARIMHATQGHEEALGSLDKAQACLGPFELTSWGKQNDPLYKIDSDTDERIVSALKLLENARGDNLAALGRVDDALAAYDRSFALTPRRSNSAPMIAKAAELIKLGRYPEAEACLAKAMTLATSRHVIATVYYNRACLFARTGDPRAIATLASALELAGDYKAMAREDEDFIGLRNDAEFQRIVGG